MEQVRFTNGYITHTDRMYKDHGVNEIYDGGYGWLGCSVNSYRVNNTPHNDDGKGFSETWDTHYCHSLIFNV